MSMMVSFCAVLFSPRDVLNEILNLIGSVSEGFFPTLLYSPFDIFLKFLVAVGYILK